MANIIMAKKLAKELRELTEALTDEILLVLKDEGISIKLVDPAHVCMGVFFIPKGILNEYTHDKDQEFGLDTDWLPKMYRRGESGIVAINLRDDNKTSFSYIVRKNFIVETHNTPDMTGYSLPKVPRLDLPGLVEFETDEMATLVYIMSNLVCDHLSINVEDDLCYVKAHGDLFELSAKLCDAAGQPNVKSLYPLDYINNIVRGMTNAETCKMHLGTDYPVVFEGKTRGGIEFQYLLAPRIESD